jgi:purine-binding chemotaxis protein CheW
MTEAKVEANPAVSATAETEDGEERHLETIAVLGAGGELYGITAERLSEITRLQEITEVPNSPDFVEGVVNLRGLIVPIVDLRRHLQLPFEELSARGRIVVIEVQSEAGENSIGLIVDSVEEVRIIDQDLVDNETEVVSRVGTDFLRGVVKLEDSLIVLLDIDAIFANTI